VAARPVLPLSTDVVVSLLAIVAVALVGGLGPALLAAAVGGTLLNFFLTPPLYTFAVAERDNVVTLSVMVAVAVLVAGVVDRAAHRGEQATAARTEATLLASFARTVLTATDPLPRLLERVREAFGLDSVTVLERADRGWKVLSHTGPADAEFTGPEAADIDVQADPDIHLVARGHALAATDRRVLEAVAGQALLALRAQRLAERAATDRRHAETTELRTALLSDLGHDLRTPLTSIQAAIDGLRDDELKLSPCDIAELLATIDESTVRLRGLVNNLLDSSRLATGAITPQLCATGYDETLATALPGLADHHRVTVEVDETLPDVLADPGLLDRVVANLVDNALRHGAGAPVAVRASAHAGRVELRVVDRGPGAPRHSLEMIFAPFQRLGDRDTTTGLGLGLAVARGFTEAMGGTLTVEDTPGGGLTAVLSLPAASCSTTAATP
jgi:two-component system sensor histidine kinase KdpD